MTFNFIENPKREDTPLLIGLVSPSGGGKTKSALRLATGIQRVRGGKLVGIDTEARRMRHYANEMKIDHYLEFKAPFSSLRYLDALKVAAEKAEGGVVIVDSMSHEHEGEGGYLEYHETELNRMAGDDWKKRERMTFTAWIKPAGERRRLINTILQMNCAFVFCFRAKEKLKIVKGQEPIQLGWQAIAGEEFAFEMTVRCLLQPGSKGVPDWSPEAFKNGVPKRSDDHAILLPDGQQLNEEVGERLARWAKGENYVEPTFEELHRDALTAAYSGSEALLAHWKKLGAAKQKILSSAKDNLKAVAAECDAPSSDSSPTDNQNHLIN